MLSDDGIRPLLTAVVRLKSYGKSPVDVHTCKSKRPHLLVLFPDAIHVFTTSDAGEDAPESTSVFGAPTKVVGAAATATQAAFARLARRAQVSKAVLAAGASEGRPSEVSPDISHAATAAASVFASAPDGGDADDLAPGQVFRLGVALSQVLSVDVVKENRLQVWYQPNRPSKKGTVEEQTMMVLKSILGAMDYRSSSSSLSSSASSPSHKNAHHFTMVCTDEDEALELKCEVERAQRQLALATVWLSDGLPLCSDSKVTMVTVGPSSARASSTGQLQDTSPTFAAVHALPFAQWNKDLVLPADVGDALANPASRRCVGTVISVYLQTPLGRAVSEIPLLALQRSAAEGGAPVESTARLQDPPGEDSLRPGKRWAVTLQWRAVRGQQRSTSGAIRNSGSEEEAAAVAQGGVEAGGSSSGVDRPNSRGSNTRGASPKVYAGSRAAEGQEVVRTGGGNVGILLGLVAVSGFLRLMRAQIAKFGAPPGGMARPGLPGQTSQPPAVFDWQLCLLDIDISEEVEPQELPPASPPVKRSLSVSVKAEGVPTHATSGRTAIVAPGGAGSSDDVTLMLPPVMVPLPHHISLLVQQYPGVLTHDIARRFIVGLGSETKAFAALSSMAQWTAENGLADIVQRPQPAFAAMKEHYPHGFPGWSKKKDCLVEVEAMGRWPRAYTAIAAAGVTEQQMLEHLLFVYQYAFSKIDARHLPHGKTVKIVDLEGLGMSDLKTPGFKLITRVGAMLSLNYPQRLHRCFLVNAPGWWAVAWRLVSPIIPPKVRAQMSLYGKNDSESAKKALLEWIDEDVLPVKYGGKNEVPMHEWTFETQLASYVEEVNSKSARSGGEDVEEAEAFSTPKRHNSAGSLE